MVQCSRSTEETAAVAVVLCWNGRGNTSSGSRIGLGAIFPAERSHEGQRDHQSTVFIDHDTACVQESCYVSNCCCFTFSALALGGILCTLEQKKAKVVKFSRQGFDVVHDLHKNGTVESTNAESVLSLAPRSQDVIGWSLRTKFRVYSYLTKILWRRGLMDDAPS